MSSVGRRVNGDEHMSVMIPGHRSVTAGLAVVAVAGFLLGLCRVVDTDVFMHLSIGRLIWETAGIPERESFVYTMTSHPFLYSSALFASLLHLVFTTLGYAGLSVFQALAVALFCVLAFLDARRPRGPLLLTVLVVVLAAAALRYRYVLRPDILMAVFFAFTVWALRAYVREERHRALYFVPVIALLWANVQSSVVLTVLIHGAFIGAAVVGPIARRFGVFAGFYPTPRQGLAIAAVLAASVLLGLINPNGAGQYTFGGSILATRWYAEEIIELRALTWEEDFRALAVLAAVVLLLVASWVRAWRRPLQGPQANYLTDFALLLPACGMALMSIRFLFLVGVVATPLVARHLAVLVEGVPPPPRWAALVATALAVLATVALSLGQIGPFRYHRISFGAGEDLSLVPEAALRYMDDNGIEGRVFNSFRYGGYIFLRDGMRRPVFIDPRGYVTGELLNKYTMAQGNWDVVNELQATYGFEAVLVQTPAEEQQGPDTRSRARLAGWELVFWDGDARVYVRREGPYGALAARDAFQYLDPLQGIGRHLRQAEDPQFAAGVLAELQRSVVGTHTARVRLWLGLMLNEVGRYEEAVEAFNAGLAGRPGPQRAQLLGGLGFALANLGDAEEAAHAYERALELVESPAHRFNLAMLYGKLGRLDRGVREMERVVADQPGNAAAWQTLAELYERLGRSGEAGQARARAGALGEFEAGKDSFMRGTAAFVEKRYDEARRLLEQSLQENPASPDAHTNLAYVYLNLGERDASLRHHLRALELSPKAANSHYGAGMLYLEMGQAGQARYHLEAYLALQPTGHYARLARATLNTLEP